MSDTPARAIPKSVTRTRPSVSISTLWGLMSRCTMPRLWAKRAARRIWSVMSAEASGGAGPRSRMMSFSVRPSTNSIAM